MISRRAQTQTPRHLLFTVPSLRARGGRLTNGKFRDKRGVPRNQGLQRLKSQSQNRDQIAAVAALGLMTASSRNSVPTPGIIFAFPSGLFRFSESTMTVWLLGELPCPLPPNRCLPLAPLLHFQYRPAGQGDGTPVRPLRAGPGALRADRSPCRCAANHTRSRCIGE